MQHYPRELIIQPVLNGFVLIVGCQRVVFPNAAAMCGEISAYYTDPLKTEIRFRKDAVNATLGDAVCPPVNPPFNPDGCPVMAAPPTHPYPDASAMTATCAAMENARPR